MSTYKELEGQDYGYFFLHAQANPYELNLKYIGSHVRREGDSARVRIGPVSFVIPLPILRDMCNDMAEVLDGWYEERDRLGATNERA